VRNEVAVFVNYFSCDFDVEFLGQFKIDLKLGHAKHHVLFILMVFKSTKLNSTQPSARFAHSHWNNFIAN
jgi:hypothetical protein